VSDAWKKLAACRDAPVTIFFPHELSKTLDELVLPMRYCASCPVVAQCDGDVRRNDWGVRGGKWYWPPDDVRHTGTLDIADVARFHPEVLARDSAAM
jgi:hypothetical protein